MPPGIMSTFFTSDLHFGHANIIKYCNRPFANVHEMNKALIENWNVRVTKDDTVYVLGDVSFLPAIETDRILSLLNGKIHLIRGNHDKKAKLNYGRFASVNDLLGLKINEKGEKGQYIVMCHYALKVWEHRHHGAWHIFGHSHGSLPDDPYSKSIDIGVDCHDYKPVSFQELRAIMDRKQSRPVDHHGQEGYTGE